VAAFATGVIVARLTAAKATRMRYLIGTLHLGLGLVPALTQRQMDPLTPNDNPDLADWIDPEIG
jgi:hypothetical protein